MRGAFVVGLCASCVPLTELDVPGDAAWIAYVSDEEMNAPVVIHRTGGVVRTPIEALALMWSEADLRGLISEGDSLRVGRDCEAAVPEPRWVTDLQGAPAEWRIRLTTNALAARCPCADAVSAESFTVDETRVDVGDEALAVVAGPDEVLLHGQLNGRTIVASPHGVRDESLPADVRRVYVGEKLWVLGDPYSTPEGIRYRLMIVEDDRSEVVADDLIFSHLIGPPPWESAREPTVALANGTFTNFLEGESHAGCFYANHRAFGSWWWSGLDDFGIAHGGSICWVRDGVAETHEVSGELLDFFWDGTLDVTMHRDLGLVFGDTAGNLHLIDRDTRDRTALATSSPYGVGGVLPWGRGVIFDDGFGRMVWISPEGEEADLLAGFDFRADPLRLQDGVAFVDLDPDTGEHVVSFLRRADCDPQVAPLVVTTP